MIMNKMGTHTLIRGHNGTVVLYDEGGGADAAASCKALLDTAVFQMVEWREAVCDGNATALHARLRVPLGQLKHVFDAAADGVDVADLAVDHVARVDVA